MPRPLSGIVSDTEGAIAPMYVIAIFVVLAMAGVGYDYGQLASLDTELQNAADQAALAAATQLSGQSGSIDNAKAAANATTGLVSNKTVMAGDAATNRTLAVSSAGFEFYASAAAAEAGTPTTTSDKDARFVKVTMNARTADYALTPLVGLFTSPSISAAAVAGLSSSLCKVPPVMICNPAPDPTKFVVSDYVGKGLLLTFGNNGNTNLTAGMVGFLDPGQQLNTAKNKANKQDYALLVGRDTQIGGCVSVTNPFTQEGTTTYVINAFNTRFDIYDSNDPVKCYQDGLCSPSDNARKDVLQNYNGGSAPTSLGKNDCRMAPGNSGQGWVFPPKTYRPTSATLISPLNPGSVPDAMGYPRDLNHAIKASSITSRIGNGTWDFKAYWYVNYNKADPGTTVYGKTNPTRYEVYKWERANSKLVANNAVRTFTTGGKKYADYNYGMCLANKKPNATTPDRRVLSAAVVNCGALPAGTGAKAVTPLAWIDVFLVEPSLVRTDSAGVVFTNETDMYVEVIGNTTQGSASGTSGTQFVRRDKPYIVK